MDDKDLKDMAQWDDSCDENSDAVELNYSDNDIKNCVKDVLDYVLASTSVDNFNEDETPFLMCSVPIKANSLLAKFFDKGFTMSSRDVMLEELYDAFIEYCSENVNRINEAISALKLTLLDRTVDAQCNESEVTGQYKVAIDEFSGSPNVTLDAGVFFGSNEVFGVNDEHNFEVSITLDTIKTQL